MRDPDDNDRFRAAQLGHALRVARVVADRAESAPDGTETQMPAAPCASGWGETPALLTFALHGARTDQY